MEPKFKGWLEKFGLLKKGGKGILGIDIGTSSIKIVQLRKEKERAILETYGEIAIGPYANLSVGQVAKLDEEAVVAVIKDVLKESNAKAQNTVMSIPLKSSFVTVISLPFSHDADISQIIQMEARRYIPVPISEVILDWWVIPEGTKTAQKKEDDGGGKKRETIRVLLVAIHKDVISNYKRMLASASLKAEAYEIESFSMVRSCLGREISPVAMIDFGASATKIAIVDYGAVKASYLINSGSQNLTVALSNSLGVDFSRAEEMKREIGFSDLPEHKEIVTVIEPILDNLFLEIDKFIKDFQKKYNRSVGKVILTGGGSLLKGLTSFSVKKLTVATALADPFSKVEHPVFLSNALTGVGVNFSVAIGLALREL